MINKDKGEHEQIDSVPVNKNKILPQTILNSDSYLTCLESMVMYFKKRLKEKDIKYEDTNNVISDIRHLNANIDETFLALAAQKLMHLTSTLEIAEPDFFRPLDVLTTAGQFLANYSKGFKVIFQPNPLDGDIMEPLLTLACMDASLAMGNVWKLFPSVILTSGTISPL